MISILTSHGCEFLYIQVKVHLFKETWAENYSFYVTVCKNTALETLHLHGYFFMALFFSYLRCKH